MSPYTIGDGADFEAVREKAEALYGTIGTVRCPYFNEDIAFNAKGIRHLKFKADEQARPQADQYPRLKLLRLAPEVLRLSRTVQGLWCTQHFEPQKSHSRWERVLKHVTFYEFMAVLENVRVKVIVKEVAGGEKHFWSIIPFWGQDATTHRRIVHTGNPAQD